MQTSTRLRAEYGGGFGEYLVQGGKVSISALLNARANSLKLSCSLTDSLRGLEICSEEELARYSAEYLNLPFIDLKKKSADRELLSRFDLGLMLKHRVVPLQSNGSSITFAISDSSALSSFVADHRLELPHWNFVFASPQDIIAWLTRKNLTTLTNRAASRVTDTQSCRTWEKQNSLRRFGLTLALIAALIASAILAPYHLITALICWTVVMLAVIMALRITSYLTEMSTEPEDEPPPCPDHALPYISVIVPLFKEREIADALLRRLARLSYPKALLDVVLAVEEHDHLTKDTISAATLPAWITVVEVPEGAPKTKPRALNYALDHCRGDIIGIWDAEDAPAPDQLETVARYFHSANDDVACLQGILDYYNPRQNWFARCFTIEYASWFRLILPGMARLGFAIPLGGTTLFCRRAPLEEIGGWDAHNVTEDADLGFRLARYGYRTDVVPTRTGEEANCRPWAWVKQRSRWLKGYMVTYLVHMRCPRLLYKELGLWRFIGFQAHFVAALTMFLFAPLLWSFWLVLLGVQHPLASFAPPFAIAVLGASFLAVELLNLLIYASAVRDPNMRFLLPWVPTMHLCFPLGTIAAYKALYELIVKPFYWDKTMHGLSLNQPNQASDE